MTDEMRARIEACTESSALEDIYLPYRPKRKTRAGAARDKGLRAAGKDGDEAGARQSAQSGRTVCRQKAEGVPDAEAALQEHPTS